MIHVLSQINIFSLHLNCALVASCGHLRERGRDSGEQADEEEWIWSEPAGLSLARGYTRGGFVACSPASGFNNWKLGQRYKSRPHLDKLFSNFKPAPLAQSASVSLAFKDSHFKLCASGARVHYYCGK